MKGRHHLAVALLAFVSIQSAAGQSAADLVLVNANIRTLDRRNPRAEALAAANGRIIAVGRQQQIRPFIGQRTRVIDARGRLVIPGFNDSHVHFTAIGTRFFHLEGRNLKTGDELLARIAEHASILPEGVWILGSGLDRTAAGTLSERDAASGSHPLLIYFADPSFAAVNSAAMSSTAISGPDGIVAGEVVRRVRRNVPADYGRNWNEIIETASTYAASLGVTSVQDVHSDYLFDVYLDIARRGKLKTRIYECIGLNDRRKLVSSRSRPGRSLGLVRNGCAKGLGTGEDGEVDALSKDLEEADAADLQVMIHAIGESANANVLDAFERATKADGFRDRRFRIEHGHQLSSTDVGRLARSGAIVSMQPYLFDRGGVSVDDYRSLLSSGVRLAFGSDAPMTDFNPLLGVQAAVNAGRHSISPEEAVRAYTLGAAFAEFQENVKGSLEVGKAADFVILSADIFAINASKIGRVKVVMTVVDGRIVFQKS